MRVGCIICSDAFANFNDVASVPCGHTFHSHCVLQWIENSKSCPTCRHKATTKSVQKLFFESIGGETSQIDPDNLQNQIDSLKFQVVEKVQLMKNVNEDNAMLKKQNQGLRDECIKLEKSLKDHETTMSAYKDQVKHMNDQVKTAVKDRENAKTAKEELKLYKSIKLLLSENSTAIDETIISNSSSMNSQESIKSLSTISCVLKSRVNKLMEEKKKCVDENHMLLSTLKETKKKLNYCEEHLVKLQREFSLQQDDVKSLEGENKSLQKKISKLKDAIHSPSADVKNSVIQRFISESPMPLELRKRSANVADEVDLTPECKSCVCDQFRSNLERFSDSIVRKVSRTSFELDSSSTVNSNTQGDNEASPYLQVKSASITALNLPSVSSKSAKMPLKNSNIFKDGKSSMHSIGLAKTKSWSAVPFYPSDDVGYDGLGGHHKVDYFPSPDRAKILPVKKKPYTNAKIFSNTKAQIPSKSVRDFFKDPFADI